MISTANFDLFDYTTGQSVRVTALTGGNPDLEGSRLRNLRLGGTFRLNDPNITLNLDYNRTWQRNQVVALPGATPGVVAAFPERFTRDADGNLVSVDLRPINIASEDKSQLRMGITFTKTLKTPQSQIDAMRESFQRRFPNGFPGRDGMGRDGLAGKAAKAARRRRAKARTPRPSRAAPPPPAPMPARADLAAPGAATAAAAAAARAAAAVKAAVAPAAASAVRAEAAVRAASAGPAAGAADA